MTLEELHAHPAWRRLSPEERSSAASSARSEAAFTSLIAAGPTLEGRADRAALLDEVRALGHAFAIAESELSAEGLLRDEQRAALYVRIEALAPDWSHEVATAALRQAGFGALLDDIEDWHREHSGLRGALQRLADRVDTAAFDIAHGGLFLATGAPDHEGHFTDGTWSNWTRNYSVRPETWLVPRTEAELCRVVAQAQSVRVVGGGHSFNDSPLGEHTMLSLDNHDRVLSLDREARTARVQAGLRLRDLNHLLWANGLALPVLGSTDAQSIGGLISTDLHGTGRDHGFLSEQVLSLRIIAADGTARTVHPGDPLFHATFGSIGTTGVVSEIELSLVPAYHLAKTTEMVDRAQAEADIESLLSANDHVSFYYIAGGERCESIRIHRWNRTNAPLTPDWQKLKTRVELKDFALSAWLPGVARALVALDEDAPLSDALAPDDTLVMPSKAGFGRKLFYRHDEIELGVPFDNYRACLAEVMDLLAAERFFSVVEVRFTPDTARSWIGPGAGRRTVWIELATPLDQDRDAVYARVEQVMRRHGGRPHLGKKTNMNANDLLELHGDRFVRFDAVRRAQDPQGRFLNPFTRRLLVPV